MRRVIAVVFATVTLASPASAQPSIEGVERSYRQGRFRAVIEAVDRVLTSERLDEATLADLLELAALSHHALGDRGGLERSLAWLAALGTRDALSQAAPPPVVEAYARARREAMALEVAIARDGPPRLELRARDAPEGFVRELRLRARFDGGPWIEGTTSVTIPEGARRVECYAWTVGPGGVAAPRIGRPGEPLVLTVGLPDVALEPGARDDTLLWGVVTGSVIAAVITGAIAIAFALAPADDTILVPRGP